MGCTERSSRFHAGLAGFEENDKIKAVSRIRCNAAPFCTPSASNTPIKIPAVPHDAFLDFFIDMDTTAMLNQEGSMIMHCEGFLSLGSGGGYVE